MNFRCEFCEISLNSDLDVSKHLVSQTHRDNVTKARQLHPLELGNGKDVPKNIVKLFECLKLRTPNDVRDLADKGYFRLPPDASDTVKVVEQINHLLAKNVAGHLCRNLPIETRRMLMDSFDYVKKESPAGLQSPTQPPTSGPSTPDLQLQTETQRESPVNPSPNQLPKPSPEFRANEPNPASTPATLTSNRRPCSQTTTSSAPKHQTVISSIRLQPLNAQSTPINRAPRQDTVRNAPGPPNAVRLNSNQPEPSSALPNLPRPTRPLQPANLVPPSNLAPMIGACFMPRPPIAEPPPQPRPESTYLPRLARIKVEPKDTE